MDQTPTKQDEPTLTVTVFDANAAELNTLKEECKNLTIIGVNDIDGYDAVKERLRMLVNLRNRIDKRRKEFKNKVDEAGQKLLKDLEPIESDLEKKKKVVDDEKSRLKKELDELEAIKLKDRTEKLFAAGFNFNGAFYVMAHLSLNEAGVKALSEADFDKILIQAVDIAEQEKKAAEALLATNNELEKKRKELEDLEKELEAKKAALTAATMTFEQEAAMVRGEVVKSAENTTNIDAFNDNKITVSGNVVGFGGSNQVFGGVIDEQPAVIPASEILAKSKAWTPNVEPDVNPVEKYTQQAGRGVRDVTEVHKIVEALIAEGRTAEDVYMAGFNRFKELALELVNSNRTFTRKILDQEFNIFKP